MTSSSLASLFQGRRIPEWLKRFESEPDAALQDLLLGRAFLGHLNADEPTEVLLDWLQSLGVRSGFVEEVDAALAGWIRRSWGRPVLPFPGASGGVIATAWCRAADLIAFEPGLQRSAMVLTSFVLESRSFLASLSEGRARDPEGRAWLAVARHQEDRSLLDHWWRLCSLPPDVPWYHGFYGIHGLRELPAERPERSGTFPTEVAEGLTRLADALAGRVDEGWLSSNTARDELQRIADLTIAAYAGEERWVSFWRHALQEKRIKNDRAKTWIQDLFPKQLKKEIRPAQGARARWLEPDPAWARLAQGIAAKLRHNDWSAIDHARSLLQDQALFARSTGDSYFLVHSACNFAGKIREARPEQALEWAELARSFDPWNAYAWTTSAATLLTLGRREEAVQRALGAVQRFPYEVVARNGLAEVLKELGRLDEAEALYRETTKRFPDNVVARAGLAEVLKELGRLDEAEALYRETTKRFPDNDVARTGLEVLLRQRTPAKARTVERQPDSAPHKKPAPEPSGKEVAEPRTEYGSDAHPFRSQDVEVLLQDSYLLRRWGGSSRSLALLRDRARAVLDRIAANGTGDSEMIGELALVEIDQGDLDEALLLLREASKRFPGSARVRYALGRAERAAAERRRRLDPEKPEAPVLPWRGLARLDARYKPLQHLGEGRTWLVQVDGAIVDEQARNCLGALGYWLHEQQKIAEDAQHDPSLREATVFTRWWADEIQKHVFGRHLVKGYEDVGDLAAIQKRIGAHAAVLNQLEEDWVGQWARA